MPNFSLRESPAADPGPLLQRPGTSRCDLPGSVSTVPALTHRIAGAADLDVLREIIEASIEELQKGFLTPHQIAASHGFMALDSQLVRDGTYPSPLS